MLNQKETVVAGHRPVNCVQDVHLNNDPFCLVCVGLKLHTVLFSIDMLKLILRQ